MSGIYGWQTQLGIDTASTVTHRFDFQSESLRCLESFNDTNGLRGTRSRAGECVRQGLRRISGQIHLQPTSEEMSLLLPWILGGSPSGSGTVTYPLADVLPTRYVVVDRGAKVFTYTGCAVDKATIRAAQGQPIDLFLDLVGQDESTGNAGSFPALAIDISTTPFMFYDLALVLVSTAYSARDVEIIIDNAIDKERFFNSQTLVTVQATDRHCLINTNLPYGDAAAVYNTGAAGIAASATFTNGGAALAMAFANAKFPRESPTVPGRQEVMVPLRGTAYKSGSTLELITTLSVGP